MSRLPSIDLSVGFACAKVAADVQRVHVAVVVSGGKEFHSPHPTRAEWRRELFEFIDIWHNRQRRHPRLGDKTPLQFEEELQQVG